MSIAIRSQGIGDIRANGRPLAAPGLGFTRLKFPTALLLDALDEPPAYLTQFIAEISVCVPGQTPLSLGRVQAHAGWTVRTIEHAHVHPFDEQLEALERRRAGHRLEFRVDLHLQIHYESAIHSARADARFHVNESDWAEIQREIGYLNQLIVTVELPLEAPEQMRTAVQHVRAAHQHLIAGRYTDAIDVCRQAMGNLHPLADDAKAKAIRTAFAAPKETRERMSLGNVPTSCARRIFRTSRV